MSSQKHYIFIYADLAHHRKLPMLARRLKVPKAEALGHLVFIWLYALEQRDGSALAHISDEELEVVAEYEGEVNLRQALIDSKWLDPDSTIHDWEEHCHFEEAKKRREQGRERQRRYVKRKREQEEQHPELDPPSAPAFVCPVARLDLEALGLPPVTPTFERPLGKWVLAYCKAAKKASAGLECAQRCEFCKDRLVALYHKANEIADLKGIEPGAVVGQLVKQFRENGKTDLGYLIGDGHLAELRALEKNRPVDLCGLPVLGASYGEG